MTVTRVPGKYSRTEIVGSLVLVVGLALIAIKAFGAPLGALLVLGLILCIPLAMIGIHGSDHRHRGD